MKINSFRLESELFKRNADLERVASYCKTTPDEIKHMLKTGFGSYETTKRLAQYLGLRLFELRRR